HGTHTAEYTTPTGAQYHSTAPPLPGTPRIEITEIEARIGIALIDLHAA
ncbi:MAG: HNH endonuclease, partial [Mycolicibacterium sp.]|nr:HNH endonuclease [Mycolicibacterium sp.]